MKATCRPVNWRLQSGSCVVEVDWNVKCSRYAVFGPGELAASEVAISGHLMKVTVQSPKHPNHCEILS